MLCAKAVPVKQRCQTLLQVKTRHSLCDLTSGHVACQQDVITKHTCPELLAESLLPCMCPTYSRDCKLWHWQPRRSLLLANRPVFDSWTPPAVPNLPFKWTLHAFTILVEYGSAWSLVSHKFSTNMLTKVLLCFKSCCVTAFLFALVLQTRLAPLGCPVEKGREGRREKGKGRREKGEGKQEKRRIKTTMQGKVDSCDG